MKKDLTIEDFMKGKSDAESIRSKMLKSVNKNPKKTKITFITPNVVGSKSQIRRVQPPLGIACLAAVLDEYNFKKSAKNDVDVNTGFMPVPNSGFKL